ncbi:6789_t:CDS:1, partial [Dentiscutata erythropus]
VWNAREKLTILTFLDKNPSASVCNTAAKFDIQPNQIRDWRNKRAQLQATSPHVKRFNTRFWPKYPELEEELVVWVQGNAQSAKSCYSFYGTE